MTRKRRPARPTIELLPPGERRDDFDPNEGLDPIEVDEANFASEIQSEFGAHPEETRWLVRAYRLPQPDQRDNRGEEEFCCAFDRNNVNGAVEVLQRKFGGGRFKVRVYANGKLHKYYTFSIAQEREPAAQVSSFGPAEMFAMMREQQQSFRDEMRTMVTQLRAQSNPAPHRDGLDELSRIASIMKMLRPEREQHDIGAQMQTMSNVFLKGMTLAIEHGGAGAVATAGGDPGFLEIARTVAAQIPWGDLLARFTVPTPAPAARLPGPQQPQHPRVSPGAPAQPAAQPAATVEASNLSDPFWQQFKPQLQFLTEKARGDAAQEKVGLYAAFVMDNVPQPILLQVIELPDLVERFAAIEPAVSQCRPWFVELVEEIRAILSDEGASDVADDTAGAALNGSGGGGRNAGGAESHAPNDAGS